MLVKKAQIEEDTEPKQDGQSNFRGKWWHSALAGVVGAQIPSSVFYPPWEIIPGLWSDENFMTWTQYFGPLSIVDIIFYYGPLFIGGFLIGSLGWKIGRRWGRGSAVYLGGVLGLLVGFLLWFTWNGWYFYI